MTLLVTGGLGFQGAHLVQALIRQGHAVTILSTLSPRNRRRWAALGAPPGVTLVAGSVHDAEILEKTVPGHAAILHLAAAASVDASLDRPWPAFEVNTLGTVALLEACRRFGEPTQILIASSCEVYGPTQTYPLATATRPSPSGLAIVPQTEDWPLLPRSPYAASKVAADRFAYAHAVTYRLPITILRPCNIYGPGQEAGALGAVIPKFTRAALTGSPLRVTGQGQQFREFLHVDDLVAAYLAVLAAPPGVPGATYNVGSGDTHTIRDLAQQITATLPGAIEFVPGRTADVTGFLLDSTRFRAQFAWTPQVPFAQGLAQYLAGAQAQHARGEPL